MVSSLSIDDSAEETYSPNQIDFLRVFLPKDLLNKISKYYITID